jgi:hypothetical protein
MSIFTSSADQPFLVVSKDPFISSLTQPSDDEFDDIVVKATGIIEDWIESRSLVLSDFEGKQHTDWLLCNYHRVNTVYLNNSKRVSTIA